VVKVVHGTRSDPRILVPSNLSQRRIQGVLKFPLLSRPPFDFLFHATHIYGHTEMKTTIEIPDSLFYRAKMASAQRGTTLKRLVIDGLEKELAEPLSPGPVQLSPEQEEIFEICDMGYPVLKKRPVPPPDEYLRRIEELREELGV
jgi:hypothetical protein